METKLENHTCYKCNASNVWEKNWVDHYPEGSRRYCDTICYTCGAYQDQKGNYLTRATLQAYQKKVGIETEDEKSLREFSQHISNSPSGDTMKIKNKYGWPIEIENINDAFYSESLLGVPDGVAERGSFLATLAIKKHGELVQLLFEKGILNKSDIFTLLSSHEEAES